MKKRIRTEKNGFILWIAGIVLSVAALIIAAISFVFWVGPMRMYAVWLSVIMILNAGLLLVYLLYMKRNTNFSSLTKQSFER